MITAHTSASLAAFSERIAARFNAGEIRAPVHLDGGNEEQLIRVFHDVREEDWVLGSWRMQAKALLKGVPEAEVEAAVLRGRSITLCFPEYRVLSSAIVGGILPIALGIAGGIRRRGGTERVQVFVGDMTSAGGMFQECTQYAALHDLPIRWVIEDNEKSVVTPTREMWGADLVYRAWRVRAPHIEQYHYEPRYPHSGAGVRVNF